jgi:hypothetical protein
MSAVASEAKSAKPPEQQPGPQIESDRDRFETLIEYQPDAKLPAPVILVWLCALIGLGMYVVTFYLPDLAAWGKP